MLMNRLLQDDLALLTLSCCVNEEMLPEFDHLRHILRAETVADDSWLPRIARWERWPLGFIYFQHRVLRTKYKEPGHESVGAIVEATQKR